MVLLNLHGESGHGKGHWKCQILSLPCNGLTFSNGRPNLENENLCKRPPVSQCCGKEAYLSDCTGTGSSFH